MSSNLEAFATPQVVEIESLNDIHNTLVGHEDRHDPSYVENLRAANIEIPGAIFRSSIEVLKRLQDVAYERQYPFIMNYLIYGSPIALTQTVLNWFNTQARGVLPNASDDPTMGVRLDYSKYRPIPEAVELVDNMSDVFNYEGSPFRLTHIGSSQAPESRRAEMPALLGSLYEKHAEILLAPIDFPYGPLIKGLNHGRRRSLGKITTGMDDHRPTLDLIRFLLWHAYGTEVTLYLPITPEQETKQTVSYGTIEFPGWFTKFDRGEVIQNDPYRFITQLIRNVVGIRSFNRDGEIRGGRPQLA